jgi:AAHS family cis,cis-muconate transporter-like MFS transporter
MIGFVSTQYSIAFGISLLGIAYAICAIIPGLFIPNKMYDPKSVSTENAQPVPDKVSIGASAMEEA